MDALHMIENNPTLPHASQTDHAHMCGHDGHTATLVLAGHILHSQRHRIPENCTVRLLFQPAEEGPGGAEPMIEEGALDIVDEIYGLHNQPEWPEG